LTTYSREQSRKRTFQKNSRVGKSFNDKNMNFRDKQRCISTWEQEKRNRACDSQACDGYSDIFANDRIRNY